jgi:hypothetical protein
MSLRATLERLQLTRLTGPTFKIAVRMGCLVPCDNVCSWPDSVAKVENRTASKISRKMISRLLYRCKAQRGRYEGPWSFFWQAMWSLTSLSAKRISGPRKFRSSPAKDFCNSIPPTTDMWRPLRQVRNVPNNGHRRGANDVAIRSPHQRVAGGIVGRRGRVPLRS